MRPASQGGARRATRSGTAAAAHRVAARGIINKSHTPNEGWEKGRVPPKRNS